MTTAATSQQTRLVTPARRRACTCRSLWLSFPVIHDNSGDNRSHGQQEEGSCPAVVDVYQGWCGPCKPVVSLFQKMRIEVGLDLLHFALAEADHLDVLEKYRGKCEPTFLFYAIKDEALSDEDECVSHGKNNGEDEDMVSSERTCTLAIIKPDAVAHGKTDEIIMKIQEAGFEILTNEERTMTEAEMRLFYQHRAGEETFEKLVHHMCSGPSHLLILTRTEGFEDVVTTWRTVIGPCDPNVARREQPESLRAQYGTEMPFNAIHGSRDREDADRELALLFPSLKFSDKNTEALQGGEAEEAAGAH
ncbi:thioredoxin domain-containing protein 6 isoform X11 [Saimiri boliviensis]|uniref:thioredoxin domain-containing protein 6 isoform X11 n=1 Tax=Saimiri boliviensis TaxID=27679 RepID=UPI000533F4E8|nr:thioredoxin domain-containing protein 6 isoform X6 [Saimiri boliviensis boliviensis]